MFYMDDILAEEILVRGHFKSRDSLLLCLSGHFQGVHEKPTIKQVSRSEWTRMSNCLLK